MSSHPEPPPYIHAIDSDAEWREIKANAAASRTGILSLEIRPESPGHTAMAPTVRVRLMPHADGLQDELATLLRWRYDGGLYYPSKARDAPERINETLARYRRTLAAASLEDLFQDLELALDRPLHLTLPGGDYLLLSEYRTEGRGPTYKVWVWLRRVSVPPRAAVDVVLGDDDRLCFESWAPSGTSCR